MYEKSFQILINSAMPYAKDFKGKVEKGIKLTGIVSTDDETFLNDIEITDAGRQGLKELCSGNLPIDGEVGLKFAKRRDLALQLGELPPEKVVMKKIGLRTPGDIRKFDIKLTMLIPNVKWRTVARIYDKFREFEQVKISQMQLDLPLTDKNKAGQGAPRSSKKTAGRIPEGEGHGA